MHSKGHFGLTLGVMSLLMIPFGYGDEYIIFLIILTSVGLSSFPDIDLQFEKSHRTLTHNILFALIIAIIFGAIFGYASGFWYGIVGFIGGFMGIMLHLLGDIMTFSKFKPLYPISRKKIAWKWFYADSNHANNGFFLFGVVAFFLYIMVSSGALGSLLF
jgi:inner membrane protein